jgi:omega-hydroxy-beta-dihydromenaquinone-9 sulfotransferase
MSRQKPIRLPHILCFSTLQNWLRLLVRYGSQADLARYPQLVGMTCFIILTLPVRLLESTLFSVGIRRHRLSQPPVFIVGHWRSGTTNMHNHLLQDPQFASVTLLHCAIPSGFLTWGWLARLIMNRRLPKSRPMDAVPLGIDEPMSEDFALAGLTHMSHYLNYFFPKIAEQTFRHTVLFENASEYDMQHWGNSYDFLLRKVSYAAGGRRLLLKNPPNVGRIPEVLKRYPDAKFIHVYRNPWLVHASTMKLTERFLEQMSFQSCPQDQVEEFVSRRYQLIMDRWLRDKALIPAQNLIEVSHEEMTTSPVAVLDRIYQQFQLPGWREVKPRLDAYVAGLANYQNNEYRFDREYLQRISSSLRPFAEHAGYSEPKPAA